MNSWQEWYESTLKPLLNYSPDQKLSSELTALLSSPYADLAILAADTDRTQEYVFESSKLPMIRGGSALLQNLNQDRLTSISTSMTGTVPGITARVISGSPRNLEQL